MFIEQLQGQPNSVYTVLGDSQTVFRALGTAYGTARCCLQRSLNTFWLGYLYISNRDACSVAGLLVNK